MNMNSDGFMFAGSAWKCGIMDFLFSSFNNGVKGQIPELHYPSCMSGTGASGEAGSDNGLLLGT